jgi:Domain of unknown function (DUF4253)/Ankyrin repeats (3 copies)/Ankyrin repeat
MDHQADALLKAAQSGRVAKLRELLAAGAPVEATDVNRMTPVMLAAQGGHAEAFRVLVEAGANLHALAFRQVDVLEMAARGGNVEIIRFLLERGLPVNGHWQPRAEALRKMGHDTPLIQAATHGHVEAVRVLLEAGADRNAKYEGQTALQQVQELLRDPAGADQNEQYRAIAQLLGEVPADGDRSADAERREVERFAENARRPAYGPLRQRLVERCGAARPWQPLPDHGLPAAEVVAFTLARCQRQKALEDLQAEARTAGCHLVLAEPWAPGEDAALVLFPTDNKLAVVAAVGTEGVNYGVQTPDVIAWLGSLDAENPFHLVFCNHELVGGAFLGPVKGAKKLAGRMVEFCPSCLDEGPDDAEELALVLKKRRSFLLRWD